MDNLVLNYLSDDSTINTKSQKKMKINHDKLTSTQATTPLNTDEIIATQSVSLSITPLVDTKDYATCNFIPGETTKELAFNVPYDDLARPQQGTTCLN